RPPAELGLQRRVTRLERLLERSPPTMNRTGMVDHRFQEIARLFDCPISSLQSAGYCAATAYEIFRAESLYFIEGPTRPVEVKSVAGIQSGLGLHKVTSK